MDFTLVKLATGENSAANGFDDVILPLRYALARLGFSVETRVQSLNPHSRNIIFGANAVEEASLAALPANSVIFNLEQLASPQCAWDTPAYRNLLTSFEVWDYSQRNLLFLREKLGVQQAEHLQLGYVPEMTRLRRDFPQDIDVLFYGSVNERRKLALASLLMNGVTPHILQGEYGLERDQAIARSKLVLNIHYYSPGILELPRLGYLWANSRAVVSEFGQQSEIPEGLEETCAFSSYDDLVPTVLALLRDKPRREQQAEAGFAAFSRLRQEDLLEKLVGRKSHSLTGTSLPDHLHAGSGRDFRPDCLNVDLNPRMNPDLLLDLSAELNPVQKYQTLRFGEIRLRPGSFKRITAFEMLEHVPNLVQTMTNFRDLLCDGGELEITVPYELSLGAVQDPTHVRSFNEMSWIYYCEWAWYLGWRDTRFSLVKLEYKLTEYGQNLAGQGVPLSELLKRPRAVEGMQVVLKKRRATAEEKVEYDQETRSFYQGAVGNWQV